MAEASWRFTPRRALAAIDLELERGAAFLFVPVFLACGALTYFGLRQEPDLLPLLAGALLVALLAVATRSRRWLNYICAASTLFLVGALAAKVETTRHDTKVIGSEIATTLTGRVVEVAHLAGGRVRLTLQVLSTERPKLRYAPERVRLTARKLPDGVAAGSVVSGYVRLMPPSGPVRPGSYDFSFESYFDGLGASGFFMKGPLLAGPAGPLSLAERSFAWVENARDRIAQRIRDRIGGAEGEIAAALVVGVRGGIPEDVNEALRRTGLYHIISISGLHMAMVAGTVMVSLRFAFAALPGFASRRPVKKYAALAALAATGGYLFISGAEVAAQRSFIMLAVMLTAVLFDRAALTMRNLAISAAIVIVVSPHEVVGPSFQMSFAATAALVGAYAWWSERPVESSVVQRSMASAVTRRMLALVVGLVATSLIAGLATSIFGAWHFQRVSPLSLLANLAVMPIVSILVMPFAVAAGLLMPLGLDGLFLDTMALGLSSMLAMATWFSERSPVDAVGLISTHSVVLASVALVIASIASTWLRIAALPFAALSLLTLADIRSPDVLVSEDGRLVGVPVDANRLAVNRARASAFIADNWQRALAADGLAKPVKSGAAGTEATDVAKIMGSTQHFVCDDGLCLVTHRSGAVIAHASDKDAAKPACVTVRVLVVDDATAYDICGSAAVTMITGRELARAGSAAIHLADGAGAEKTQVLFAISRPYRPWHAHRAFSREARGMAPYQRAGRTMPEAANVPADRAGSNGGQD
ncbi:ComEC/Rec2 family competence protein [Aminobacter sp. HY435]|uniref:ComEC/Rec2 family competence protein n=1 Tax=Aminobacter sp. HY435 TaxID=2970917 RepID=UPI0022B9B39E|nr:ComEC/Rec2 family competence protein [Aminobacter sp. HY435]